MIIKKPVITEKSLKRVESFNQYTFEVSLDANKFTARTELEEVFGVKVISITTNSRLGRPKKYGKKRRETNRANKKYMIFRLKKGDKIDLFVSK